MKLAGKAAIVTGAGAGIGRATAIRFAAEGASVMASDINPAAAEAVAAEITAQGGRAIAAGCDVMVPDAVAAMARTAREAFGCIDILVNNAGGAIVAGSSSTVFTDCGQEAMERMVGVNLMGTLFCTRAVAPEMRERRYGKIVNLASIAAVNGAKSVLYAAAKGGVIAFTKSLAIELGPYGINVNAVSPGAIATRPGPASKSTWLGRSGTADEVAGLMLYLVSEEAAFITGENIIIDGGRTCGAKGD